MYDFVRVTVLQKTTTLLEHSTRASAPITPVEAISESADAGSGGFLRDVQPVGKRYSPWLGQKENQRVMQVTRGAWGGGAVGGGVGCGAVGCGMGRGTWG